MERFRADLQNQVSKLQTEVSATKNQLSETQKKFADMKADRDRLQYDIRKMKKEVDSTGTLGELVLYECTRYCVLIAYFVNDFAERQHRELQDELTNEREFNQLHKSQVKEQKQQIDELKGKIQELSQLNKQLELFGQQRETTISEIQARCAQLVVRCSLITCSSVSWTHASLASKCTWLCAQAERDEHDEAMQQAAREKSRVEQEVQSQRTMYKILSQKYDEDVGNLDNQVRQVQSSLAQAAAELEHQRAEYTELTRKLDVTTARNESLTNGTVSLMCYKLTVITIYTSSCYCVCFTLIYFINLVISHQCLHKNINMC